MPLSIAKEISYLRKLPVIGKYLNTAFQRLVDGVNNLGNNVSVDPTGIMPAPSPIQSLTVKGDGNGTVHAVISDNNPIQKNIHYFVEYANEPNFLQPHVVHLGTSRTMNPITLPAMDDNGNAQQFFFRGYSQYPGSHPGPVIHFGGTTPTAVNTGGSVKLTLLSSTGSGTAQNSGQQSGSGFGKIQIRPQTGPKRTSAA